MEGQLMIVASLILFAQPSLNSSIPRIGTAVQAQEETFSVQFEYQAPANTSSVAVAGTFNNWSTNANPMKQVGSSNIWKITLSLSAGDFQYKFVINGSTWLIDPKAKSISDGNGNTNSTLTVFPSGYKIPAALGDGKITLTAVNHQTSLPYLNWDKEFEGGRLTIKLRLRPNDVQFVDWIVPSQKPVRMHVNSSDSVYQYDEVSIPWTGKQDLTYAFRLQDGTKVIYYGGHGFSNTLGNNLFSVDAKSVPALTPPNWVQHTVFYQIFPDRFSNGKSDEESNPNSTWNQTKNYSHWTGGNIAGMQSHFDYLRSLDISAIYFNPIFETSVYHGYETVDYLKIEPRFGTNTQFSTFTKELRSAGIRTVLDGVFNHTSTQFFPFANVVKNGAASKYVNWYTFNGFPVKIGNPPNYKAWWNYPSLPVLNHSNPDVIKYLLHVPEFWDKKASISGWRLDAAQEVPDSFWHLFQTKVKSIQPNDWIVGEDWGNSSGYINGNMWDSVMNYPFLFAVWNFVGQNGTAKPSQLAAKLMEIYGWYTPQTDRNLMNLIDSHDTVRVLTECGGDDALRNIAAELEFSWVGAPTIYYGDELGMAGGKDPDNRNPMDWLLADSSNPTLKYYRTLIAARNASPELQMGTPNVLLANDDHQTFAFSRVYEGHAALSIVNRSAETQRLTLTVSSGIQDRVWVDVLSGKRIEMSGSGKVQVELGPKRCALLLPLHEAESPSLASCTNQLNSARSSFLPFGNKSSHTRRQNSA